MPLRSRDQPFSAFVAAHRPRLLACAWLLAGDIARAETMTETALARVYEAWSRTGDPVATTYGFLVGGGGASPAPWRSDERVSLLDAAPSLLQPDLVRDLAALDPIASRIFVLDRVAGLATWQIAEVLGLRADAVHEGALRARAGLQDSRRGDDAALAAELRATLDSGPFHSGPAAGGESLLGSAAVDVRHGRMLVQRRRRRQGLVALAVAAAVALGVTQHSGDPRERSAASPPTPVAVVPTVTPPPGPPVDCDPALPTCQDRVLRAWRQQMAKVTSLHLDPKRTYFNGYAYSYTPAYETPGYWAGRPGSLGLDMFHVGRGSTEVFVQIATDRQVAERCGQTTGQECRELRLMDGNRFLLTQTTKAYEGIEVQYRPYDNQVITVVVRNVGGGRPLEIDRSQVLELVLDKRLRLPQL